MTDRVAYEMRRFADFAQAHREEVARLERRILLWQIATALAVIGGVVAVWTVHP